MINKVLMKDYGFGYPVMVSALGQVMTACFAIGMVWSGADRLQNEKPDMNTVLLLSGASALSLVLGQYPYLYLTVAFIQMLKAFSPAYMVVFLFCLRIEYPSRTTLFCILGLSLCTAAASAGEVNFNIVGVLFMASASISDALRLVLAQKLLKNLKLRPIEMIYYVSPYCVCWMIPGRLQRLSYRGYLTEATLQRLPYRGYLTEGILQRLPYRGYPAEATLQRLPYSG